MRFRTRLKIAWLVLRFGGKFVRELIDENTPEPPADPGPWFPGQRLHFHRDAAISTRRPPAERWIAERYAMLPGVRMSEDVFFDDPAEHAAAYQRVMDHANRR